MDLLDIMFNKKEEIEEQEVTKPKKPSPFEYHNKFFRGSLESKDYKNMNKYLFLTHISGEQKVIEELNNLNMLDIPIEKLVFLLQLILKSKRINYIKYPKKPKVKNEKYLDAVKWYFKVNENTARRYLEKLDKEELDNIEEAYKASL